MLKYAISCFLSVIIPCQFVMGSTQSINNISAYNPLSFLVGIGVGALIVASTKNSHHHHSHHPSGGYGGPNVQPVQNPAIGSGPSQAPTQNGALTISYSLFLNVNEGAFQLADGGETVLASVTSVLYDPNNVRQTGSTKELNSAGVLFDTITIDNPKSGNYKVGYNFEFGPLATSFNGVSSRIQVTNNGAMTTLSEIDQNTTSSFGPNVTIEWTTDYTY